MTIIDSSDYHDYVIKNGKFIGEFDQMYQNVEDPWHCVKNADSLDNDLLLALLKYTVQSSSSRTILDMGCGLGALTARMRREVSGAIYACDISPTAIEKAQQTYTGINFFVQEVGQIHLAPLAAGSVDVVIMAQLMWYVLPNLETILSDIYRLLRPEGYLLVLQYFLHPEEQEYGKGIVEDPSDLIRLARAAGFKIEQEIYINRERPQNLLLWATKKQGE